jgi:hypothetical protein
MHRQLVPVGHPMCLSAQFKKKFPVTQFRLQETRTGHLVRTARSLATLTQAPSSSYKYNWHYVSGILTISVCTARAYTHLAGQAVFCLHLAIPRHQLGLGPSFKCATFQLSVIGYGAK